MMIIEGLDDAIVGWARLENVLVAVYSCDRIAIELEKRGLDHDDTRQIIAAIESGCRGEGTDIPIFVRTGDANDLQILVDNDEEDI